MTDTKNANVHMKTARTHVATASESELRQLAIPKEDRRRFRRKQRALQRLIHAVRNDAKRVRPRMVSLAIPKCADPSDVVPAAHDWAKASTGRNDECALLRVGPSGDGSRCVRGVILSALDARTLKRSWVCRTGAPLSRLRVRKILRPNLDLRLSQAFLPIFGGKDAWCPETDRRNSRTNSRRCAA
jgi:bifunctional DNA-binding transcriptional regulator/antitoxin component of YhaV-PrlF toxin-antitoxin module